MDGSVSAALADQRSDDARAEDQRDRGERVLRADLAEQLARGHLEADRDQQQRERGLEVVEPLDELGDEEEQRPQAEQRERVRGEGDERVVRDGEDGRDGVDGEATSTTAIASFWPRMLIGIWTVSQLYRVSISRWIRGSLCPVKPMNRTLPAFFALSSPGSFVFSGIWSYFSFQRSSLTSSSWARA